MSERKKVLFFGLSYFAGELLDRMLKISACIAVDSDPAIQQRWQNNENLSIFLGDANSIILWKKLPLEEVSHIIFSIRDADVIEELCRIARETFSLEIPIIGITSSANIPEFFNKYNITSVDPLGISTTYISMLIEQNYAIPANIGQGKGEIIEVTIVRRSHMINRKLRYMESSRWKVAVIYRDGEVILPDGDSELHVGDKVILVGEPNMLKNMAKVLMQGIPQFPLQYGRHINVVLGEKSLSPMEEVNYFRMITQAQALKCYGTQEALEKAKADSTITAMEPQFMKPIKSYDDSSVFSDAGIVAYSLKKCPESAKSIKYFLRHSTSPVLFARGNTPYSSIEVLLNSHAPSQVLQVALEISRLSSLPMRLLYVAPPKSMRNAKLEEELASVQRVVRDYENIERTKLEFTVKEGNPVRETLASIKEVNNPIVVIGNTVNKRISSFSPHIPYLLIRRLKCSALSIPINEDI